MDVDAAVEQCLESSPFSPDISEVRARLGLTGKKAEERVIARAADAWVDLLVHLRRFAETDENGRWRIKANPVRIVRRDGKAGYDADGSFLIEAVKVPELAPQTEWCLKQVGGIARVKDTDVQYLEVVRRDFMKAWQAYEPPTAPLFAAVASGEQPIDADTLIRERLARRKG